MGHGCWTKNRGGFYPPKWMVKIMKTPLKFMIWGYPYFWKHPYAGIVWAEIKIWILKVGFGNSLATHRLSFFSKFIWLSFQPPPSKNHCSLSRTPSFCCSNSRYLSNPSMWPRYRHLATRQLGWRYHFTWSSMYWSSAFPIGHPSNRLKKCRENPLKKKSTGKATPKKKHITLWVLPKFLMVFFSWSLH